MIAIRQATRDDIDLIIRLRQDYYRLTDERMDETGERRMATRFRDYLERNLGTDRFLAYFADLDGEVAGGALLTVWERPPGPMVPNGRVATLFNVLTYPQYRRRGVARRVVAAVLAAAKTVGVSAVDLLATDDGRELYEKLGFAALPWLPMRLSL